MDPKTSGVGVDMQTGSPLPTTTTTTITTTNTNTANASITSLESEKLNELEDSASTSTAARMEDAAGATAAAPQPEKQPAEPELEQEELSRKSKFLIVLSLCLCVFLSALDQTIITTAIPVIAGEFQSPSAYTWIGSSYLLASAAFMPSWGKFSDIWGRKPVLLAAAVLFMIGSVLCAAANGIELMLLGRIIQGLGAGGQLSLVNVTISDIVTMRERGLYLSYVGMTWAAASAIGPVLGGVFTGMASWGWRFCFIINIPMGFIAILGLYLFLHLQSPTISLGAGIKRVDWLGTFLIVTGVILFLVGLEFGGLTHPWGSPIVVCFLAVGVLLMLLFLLVEYRFASQPIMPLRLFTHLTSISCYSIAFFHGFVFIAGCYFLPLYFQAVRGATPLLSGVYVLPYVVVLSLAAALSGVLISRSGRYQEVIWFGVLIQTVGFGLLVKLTRTSGWSELVIYQLLGGIGSGPLFQSPLIAIHATVAPADMATATTTFAFLRTLGTALAISLGLVVFGNTMAKTTTEGGLSDDVAKRIGGESASASIEFIKSLDQGQQEAAQDAYATGMRAMWWFFLAIALCAVVASVGVGRHHLSDKLNSSQPAMSRKQKAGKSEEVEMEKV